MIQNLWDAAKAVLEGSWQRREVDRNIILHQETRKISNKQPNFTPKATRERGTNKIRS